MHVIKMLRIVFFAHQKSSVSSKSIFVLKKIGYFCVGCKDKKKGKFASRVVKVFTDKCNLKHIYKLNCFFISGKCKMYLHIATQSLEPTTGDT